MRAFHLFGLVILAAAPASAGEVVRVATGGQTGVGVPVAGAAERDARTIVTGRALVKLPLVPETDGALATHIASLSAEAGVHTTFVKRSVFGWVVLDVDAADADTTRAAVARLAQARGVLAASTVAWLRPLRAPNDALYPQMWAPSLVGLEDAWDQSIGASSQRVGIVDTGMRRDHVDLSNKDVAGWDFISDAYTAKDGNGRDADYEDVDPIGGFHGSHVAGTIGASADDGVGIPGINWNAGLVSARALAGEGGDGVDVVEAAAWLAGFHVDGVPDLGTDRASVINMSLGHDGACDAFQADVYGQIISSGVVVVAAAGNSGNDVPTGSPASCAGVIAVGAFDSNDSLSIYSNFDARIDVVAPGGDTQYGGGAILSVDGSSSSGWIEYEGTSMATPHVAGVVSLMLAVNPQLSPRQVREILLASPYTCVYCDDHAALWAPDALAQAGETAGEQTGGGGGGSDGNDDAGGVDEDGCPAHSNRTSDGTQCQCEPGYIVDAAGTACVVATDDVCGPHATLNDAGNQCICDDGYVVNATGDACVAEGGPGVGGGVSGGDKPGVEDDNDEEPCGGGCGDGYVCETDRVPEGVCRRDRGDDAGGCSSTVGAGSVVPFLPMPLVVRFMRRRGARRGEEVRGEQK